MAGAATRRRADELLDAVRAAVRAELADRGYAGVTYEGVARRAGTSKPVLYRRYASRAAMVVDALTAVDAGGPPWQPSGPLAADLVRLADVLVRRLGRDGVATFLGVMAEADADTVARAGTQMFGVVRGWLEAVVESARDRGELGPRPVPARVVSAVVSLLRGELLFAHATRSSPDLHGLAEEVVVPLLRLASGALDAAPPQPQG